MGPARLRRFSKIGTSWIYTASSRVLDARDASLARTYSARVSCASKSQESKSSTRSEAKEIIGERGRQQPDAIASGRCSDAEDFASQVGIHEQLR